MKEFINFKTGDTKVINRGASTCSLLGIAFIVLKLVGCINWSWWWVLAPFWIPVCIAAVCGVIIYVLLKKAEKNLKAAIDKIVEEKNKKQEEPKDDSIVREPKKEVQPKKTASKKETAPVANKVKEDTPKKKPRKKKVANGESTKKNG